MKESDTLFVQPDYENTDRISIKRSKINTYDNLYVYYVSIADEYNKAICTWQNSFDGGITWETIRTSSCIVVDNELDAKYRVCVDLNQQFIVDLMRPKYVVNSDYPFNIYVEETNDKDLLLYRLTEAESEVFDFVWQESIDGNLWSDINSDEYCLINTDNGKQYRLIVNVNSYLCSEYTISAEMTNEINYPDSNEVSNSDDSNIEPESSDSVYLDRQEKEENEKEAVEQNGDEQGSDKFSDDESIEINSDIGDEADVIRQGNEELQPGFESNGED